MSYDLYVVRPDIPEDCWYYVCDRDHEERSYDQYGRYFNYTYNLGPFFDAYHVRPSTDLDGKTGRECAEIIGHALMRTPEPKRKRKKNILLLSPKKPA